MTSEPPYIMDKIKYKYKAKIVVLKVRIRGKIGGTTKKLRRSKEDSSVATKEQQE